MALRGYDATSWHRAIPGQLVQGGDPRGDGRGSMGGPLREEIGLDRIERGVVGLAPDAPGILGTQLVLFYSRQPQWDGEVTVIGQIVDGFDILDRVMPGDRIRRVRLRN